MPNVVEIEIHVGDSGDGFAAVLAKVATLKKMVSSIGGVTILGSNIDSTLAALKSKLAAHRIADLLDINIQPGQIEAQLLLLKRLIGQAKINDILDLNVDPSTVLRQLSTLELAIASTDIPLHVGLSTSEVMAQVAAMRAAMGGAFTSGFGPGPSMRLDTGPVVAEVASLHATMLGLDSILVAAAAAAGNGGAGGGLRTLAAAAGDAIGPVSTLSYGWGRATGGVLLFGGALKAAGVPAIIASVGAVHLLTDAVLETAAVVIPATVAFLAFGAAAAPTAADIYHNMSNVLTVSTALGQNIYPLSGQFSKVAAAVQPEVYVLFGEALTVMNAKTGAFLSLAQSAGHVLDQLGARAAVAMSSGGLGAFMKNGPADLAKFGDIIGNIFGTVGNLLRVMPGYAEILLSALDGVTKAIEAVTGSGLGQWLLGAGLAVHGFVIWGGLAATGAVLLGNALIGLAAKFGLVEAGALAFDAIEFGAGLSVIGHGVADAAVALVTFSGAEDLAAASTTALDGAMIALGAVNPLVWVGLAAAALGGFVYWLVKGTSATDAYGQAVQKSLGNSPLSNLGTNIIVAQAMAVNHLADAQKALAVTQEYANVVNLHTGAVSQQVTQAWSAQTRAVQQAHGDVAQVSTDYANYNAIVGAAHGNLGLLNQAGITSNDIMGASGQKLAQLKIEATAAYDAFMAMGIGTGRAAAGLNALGNSSNEYISSTLPQLQKMTQAEDSLLSVILAGPQAFTAFETAISKVVPTAANLAQAAKLAHDNIGGLSAASMGLATQFYTSAVPAAQKMIDALQQQGISTGNLRTAVATMVGQMTPYIGKNVEARSVLVDLINNALGPGTVSLKDLNKWVGQNSTSLGGLNSIIAQSTIQAGTLASTLQNDLNAQFRADLLASSGADAALKTYTSDLVHNTENTAKGKFDRQQLITDLENSGLSAKQARTFVDNLQKSIDGMHGKNVGVGVTGSAGGKLTYAQQLFGMKPTSGSLLFAAGGARVPGYGGGDSVPALLEPGETVIDKDRSREYAWLLRKMGVPGYASGGVVGNPQTLVDWASGAETRFALAVEQGWASGALNALKADMAKVAQQQQKYYSAHAGPGGGAPAANAALARRLFPQWATGANWAAWNTVAMDESGWNQFAYNPSGAYGIPQALPFTKMPKAAWPSFAGGSSNPTAQIDWMAQYMAGVYGGPQGAAAHERAYHWYGDGVTGAVFTRPTLIGVGDGQPERVDVTPVGRGGGTVSLEISPAGSSAFEQFMVQALRNWVRVKGGGNVQKAFGVN